MFLDIFQYSFIIRALEAGIIVAIIAPLIGIFLVLRRYSLIADTLAHVSLAGIAIGLITGINTVVTTLATTILASLGIEKLRTSKKVYGESALALFLSGSLALAIVLLSIANGFNSNLFNYLFGSILTVTVGDVYVVAGLAVLSLVIFFLFFKEFVYVSFDEETAKASGIPTGLVNTIFIVLTALVVSLSIPIVGVLLITAMIVIPTTAAMQLKKSFIKTIIYAEIISVFSVIAGIFTSFYLNLSTGGTIVLIMLVIFGIIFLFKKR